MSNLDANGGRITCLATSAFLVAGIIACSTKPEVTGEVLDGFGKPLSEATVKVEKTTFSAMTDSGGRYAVEYVPGKVVVTITKDGYTSHAQALDVATESKYPAEPVTLYKIPTEKGLFLFGTSDYTPLTRGKQLRTSSNWDRTHTVTGDFTPVAGDAELTFMDTDGSELLLYAVDPQGVILTHTEDWGRAQETKTLVSQRLVQIAPGVTLRKVKLAKGRYAFAFCDWSGPELPPYLLDVS